MNEKRPSTAHPFSVRSSGVLLHLTSLPGPFGSGDLSEAAFQFIDRLAAAGQTWWQMLPVCPPSPPPGNSPYSSPSAFAGSPFLISLTGLQNDGLLDKVDLRNVPRFGDGAINFPRVRRFRWTMLRRAWVNFSSSTPRQKRAFAAYCQAEAGWLDDDALFGALLDHYGEAPWHEWPKPIRDRQPGAMAAARRQLAAQVGFHQFLQYIFDRQWRALRTYAARKGVSLIGDLPIFVGHDSVSVWCRPDRWLLNKNRQPTRISGTPPDMFSATGQRWGHPIYNWNEHAREEFQWWKKRIASEFRRFDALRIDHFVGLTRMWSIPAASGSATDGRWLPVPGEALLTAVTESLGPLPMIAEDLGVLTTEAAALRDRFGLPGMRILPFGFMDGSGTYHRPHAYPPQSVAYTGTHDNDTAAGFMRSLRPADRRRVSAYAGSSGQASTGDLIRLVMQSSSNTAIFPMQDILGLGSSSRMNTPGRASGNWRWRMKECDFSDAVVDRLRLMTERYDRVGRQC
ncbi:MAG: 4-alpha-glucanotransferase [Phycisphaerales bacterium]|nr:4-alpha-glucanotransferase [Phycisphaerales bacterium]